MSKFKENKKIGASRENLNKRIKLRMTCKLQEPKEAKDGKTNLLQSVTQVKMMGT